MSKYTTLVRFILESKSGLEESKGFNNIDNVIANSWDKIFTSKVNFFDEKYRQFLCSKILKHYYFREIGMETVGQWMYYMNTKLEEIMPYYNQLYESAKLQFEPFIDTDLTRTNTLTKTNESKENGTTNNNGNNNTILRDAYSDTPQGGLNGVESGTYLTNARKTTTDNNYNNSGTSTKSTTGKDNETHTETVRGKQGSGTYSKYLIEYRTTMLNIDMQVINEFSDLFFLLW